MRSVVRLILGFCIWHGVLSARGSDRILPDTIEGIVDARNNQEASLAKLLKLDSVFPNNRSQNLFYLPHKRIEEAAPPPEVQSFSHHIASLAAQAVRLGDAPLGYQLLCEAAYFGNEPSAKIVGLDSKPPQVRLASSTHPRLKWKRKRYYRVETNHFQIVTRDEQAGVEIAERLERLYSVWSQLFFDCWCDKPKLTSALNRSRRVLPTSKKPLRVVLFANREEYVAFLRPKQPRIAITLGFYDVQSRTSYFFAGPESSPSTHVHEVTHQLFQEVASGVARRLTMQKNFWAVEGVAMYMESLDSRGPVATVGGVHAHRLQFARYRRLQEQFHVPLPELVTLGRDELQSDKRIRRIYSESAGLTHFLMDANNAQYRSGFVSYLRSIYEGRDRADTLAALTSTSLSDLDEEYVEFLNVKDQDFVHGTIPTSTKSLCLGDTLVTDRGLLALGKLPELDWLDLSRTKVGDQGLSFLKGSESLRQVSLDGTQITDESLRVLALQRGLEELDLSNTAVTDAGMELLLGLSTLKVLWLSNTQITDATLDRLGELKSLEFLNVDGTGVSAPARLGLRKKLPNLTIE